MVKEVNAVPPIYLELVDFVASGATSEAVANAILRRKRRREWRILGVNGSGGRSSEECAELNRFPELEHILRMAKAKARLMPAK